MIPVNYEAPDFVVDALQVRNDECYFFATNIIIDFHIIVCCWLCDLEHQREMQLG